LFGLYNKRIPGWFPAGGFGHHGASQVAFARHIHVPTQRVNEIVRAASAASHRTQPGFFHRPLAPRLSSG
jgi:plasmid maintenance system antidote protein VapI